MDDKPSLKVAWLHRMSHLIFLIIIHILGMAEARAVKFCTCTQKGYIKSC